MTLSSRIIGVCLLLLLSGSFAAKFAAAQDDTEQILALHERILQAHRANSVDMMLQDAADDYVLVTRGEVLYPDIEERTERFREYFAITTFDRYDDTIDPIVKISADGTLAWLIARVEVTGTQESGETEQALEFTSAWIELYEKRDGQWVQIGNVSNFRQ